MEGETNFPRRLKQFDGLTWLTLTSVILRQIYTADDNNFTYTRAWSDSIVTHRVCPSVFPRSNSKRLTLCSPNLEPQRRWTLFLKAWFYNYAPSNDVPTYEQKNKKFEGAAITCDLSLWAAVSQHSLQCRVMCKHILNVRKCACQYTVHYLFSCLLVSFLS